MQIQSTEWKCFIVTKQELLFKNEYEHVTEKHYSCLKGILTRHQK